MGLLAGLGSASVLIFGLTAGVFVDRMRRRPILIATDLGRAALLCSVPIAAAYHVLGMAQLYILAALAGVLTVFFDVAYQSYLPSLVQRDQLFEGNTKLMITSTAAEVVGPATTGLLVQLITAPIAMLLDAASFVFSALMMILIRRHDPAPDRTAHEEQHVWRESLAGVRFIAGEPVLRALAFRSVMMFFFAGFLGTLYVIYAIQTLHLHPATLGVTIAMGGIGGIVGSLIAGPLTRRIGLGPAFIYAAAIHGLAVFLFPLAGGSEIRAMLFLMATQLFGDCALTVYFINETSLRQTIAPARVLGRVNAAMQLATRGVVPLGAVVGGFLTEAIGVRPVLTIAAAGILASVGWLLVAPIRTLRSAPTETAPAGVI